MLVIVNSLLLSFLQFGVSLLRIVVFSFLLLVIRRRLVIGERFKAERDTDFVRLFQADTFLHGGWLEKGGNGCNTRWDVVTRDESEVVISQRMYGSVCAYSRPRQAEIF